MRARFPFFALAAMLALSSCGEDDASPGASGGAAGGGAAGTGGAGAGAGAGSGGGGMAGSGGVAGGDGGGQAGTSGFALTSTAFSEGKMIPAKYECTSGGGQNVSPPLSWTAGPMGTQSYALIMRDLDYMNGFLHWVIWDIPASVTTLSENVQQVYQPSSPAGAKQAPFMGGVIGYYGPCSPSSTNTYEFTIYAMPAATIGGLNQQSTKTEAAGAIVGSALASAKLAGES